MTALFVTFVMFTSAVTAAETALQQSSHQSVVTVLCEKLSVADKLTYLAYFLLGTSFKLQSCFSDYLWEI